MGILSKIFGSSSGIEEELEIIYIPLFQKAMGISSSEAKNTFQNILKQVKEESSKGGNSNLPQNFGDVLIENESTDEKVKEMLAKRRKEGARDEDIRWWWNLHDYERRIMGKTDDIFRLAVFTNSILKGMEPDEASAKLRKCFPMYGDPDDLSHTTGEDRPLPLELKYRINIYMEKRMNDPDPERHKKEVEESSTYNAFVRKEMRKGNI